MKTYSQLKEEVLKEYDFATPNQKFMSRTINPIVGKFRQAGDAFKDFAGNNRGVIGAGLAGAVALAGITGLLKARQGRGDNAPQTASTPVNLQTTKISAPGSVGVADKRISPPPTSFSPRKPIDNRDPTRN